MFFFSVFCSVRPAIKWFSAWNDINYTLIASFFFFFFVRSPPPRSQRSPHEVKITRQSDTLYSIPRCNMLTAGRVHNFFLFFIVFVRLVEVELLRREGGETHSRQCKIVKKKNHPWLPARVNVFCTRCRWMFEFTFRHRRHRQCNNFLFFFFFFLVFSSKGTGVCIIDIVKPTRCGRVFFARSTVDENTTDVCVHRVRFSKYFFHADCSRILRKKNTFVNKVVRDPHLSTCGTK